MLGDACFVSLTPQQLGQTGCLFGGHTWLRGNSVERVEEWQASGFIQKPCLEDASGVTNAKLTTSNPVYIQRVHSRNRDWARPEIWSWPGYSGRQRLRTSLYSRQQARNISRSLGAVIFSKTLSLAAMKSTPPRNRGISAWPVRMIAVTVP